MCAEGPWDPVFFSLDAWSKWKFRRLEHCNSALELDDL